MTKFIFVRHAEPDYSVFENAEFSGVNGELAPLTEKGINQAKELSKNQVMKDAEILICSPYARTMHTANILSLKLGLPVIPEFGLREWIPNLVCSCNSRQKVIENYKKAVNDFTNCEIASDSEYEPLTQTRKRVLDVLEKYLHYSKVIVVTHSGVLYSLFGRRFEKAEFFEQEIRKEDY